MPDHHAPMGRQEKSPVVCLKGRNGVPLSRFARLRLWFAIYRALDIIANRRGDHLLQDAGLSREEARGRLKRGPLRALLMVLRDGCE
jgi:hypothetical protein